MNAKENETVKLSNIPDGFASGTEDLTGRQKAQIKMTYWVLGGAAILLVASGWTYIGYANSTERAAAAEEVFEFCKSFIPPIVTLVLGAHYVTRCNKVI